MGCQAYRSRVSTQRENVPYYSNMRMSPFGRFLAGDVGGGG